MFTKKLRKNQNKMFSFCTQNVLRIFKTLRCLPMAKHHFLESCQWRTKEDGPLPVEEERTVSLEDYTRLDKGPKAIVRYTVTSRNGQDTHRERFSA